MYQKFIFQLTLLLITRLVRFTTYPLANGANFVPHFSSLEHLDFHVGVRTNFLTS